MLLGAALGATSLVAAACGTGSVTCTGFRAMNESDQMSAAGDLMKKHDEPDTPLSESAIRLSINAFCYVHSGETPIDGIYKV